MIAAQLDQNNVVINRIVVDSLQALPNLVNGTGAVVGATYDPQTQTFALPDPVVIVPSVVSKPAGIIAMIRAGVIDDVKADIAAMGVEAQVWFDEADKFEIDFPLVEAVRAARGWDQDFVNQLFINAKIIEAGN